MTCFGYRLAEPFGVGELPNLPPRYNIAPTQDAAVVRRAPEGAGRVLVMLRAAFSALC